MTGSLKVKNERYYAVINYKEGSQYKQKWIALGLAVKNNKRKAEAKLSEIIAQFEETYSLPNGDMSFTTYIKQWLAKKKGLIEQTTWEGYKIYAERHIIPYFEPKHLTLRDIKPQHIKEYYEYKYVSGRLDNKQGGLSIASIKKHSIVLKEVLDEAVLDEMIQRNPAKGVKLPSRESTQVERTFLTAEEANRLLTLFDGHRLQAMVYVTLYYGLRRSEALGLRWSSIDFEKNTLTINHTVVKNVSIVAKDKTKTQSSTHTYILIDDVKKVLLSEREKQNVRKRLLGNLYSDNDYVFTWDDGKLMRPDYITRSFQKVLKRNGFKPMRFHDLRHSTASILFDKGWNIKDIQMWLRHSSIEVTADIYTHISEQRKASMAESLNSTLSLDFKKTGEN